MPDLLTVTDEDVKSAFVTDFGAALFNAYTHKWPNAKEHLFSRRLFVIGRMLRAMLDAEAELAPSADNSRQSLIDRGIWFVDGER